LEMQPAIVKTAKQLYEKDPTLARQFLTDYCVSNANEVVKEWWNFSDHLIKKYSDGDGFQDEVTGYPTWWLEKVGFDEGPTSYKPEEEKK
jgi:dipeptidase